MTWFTRAVSDSWEDIYHANLLEAFVSPDFEVVNHTFKLVNPLDNVIENPARAFRTEFSAVMYNWIADGKEAITEEMLALNPNASKFATSYEFGSDAQIVTAYGPRIASQWEFAKGELKRDPNSRRACIMMLDAVDQYVAGALAAGETKCEYICTYGFNFRIRNGKLDMTATMRSNNYTTTVCQDVYIFTRLQQKMAFELNLEVGHYYHSAVSAHIIPSELKNAWAILNKYLYPQGDRLNGHQQLAFQQFERIYLDRGLL